MADMHVISDCARMIFSEITWHMADMNVMMTVSQGTDLTKKQEEMHSILDMREYIGAL